jgi:hypothetical protein
MKRFALSDPISPRSGCGFESAAAGAQAFECTHHVLWERIIEIWERIVEIRPDPNVTGE